MAFSVTEGLRRAMPHTGITVDKPRLRAVAIPVLKTPTFKPPKTPSFVALKTAAGVTPKIYNLS